MTATSSSRTASAWLTDHARELGIEGTVTWQAGRQGRGFWLHTRGIRYFLGKNSWHAERALAGLVCEPLLPLGCTL